MQTIIETIQRLQLGILLAQRMILKPPWQCLGYLVMVCGESPHRHRKDILELLERPLFGLWYEEENHYEYQDIEAPMLGQALGLGLVYLVAWNLHRFQTPGEMTDLLH
jgi:hypothetical protein